MVFKTPQIKNGGSRTLTHVYTCVSAWRLHIREELCSTRKQNQETKVLLTCDSLDLCCVVSHVCKTQLKSLDLFLIL